MIFWQGYPRPCGVGGIAASVIISTAHVVFSHLTKSAVI